MEEHNTHNPTLTEIYGPQPDPDEKAVILDVDPHAVIYIQSRAEFDPPTAARYVEDMKAGIKFDPAEGIRAPDGQIYVWDGQHRGDACMQLDYLLSVRVVSGTQAQAEWLGFAANKRHGRQRTRADINHAITQALLKHADLSDRALARHIGCHHETVGARRKALVASGEIPASDERTITRGDKTYKQKVKPLPLSPEHLQTLARQAVKGLSSLEQVQTLYEKIHNGLYKDQLLLFLDNANPAKGQATSRTQILTALALVMAEIVEAEKAYLQTDLMRLSCPHCDSLTLIAQSPPDGGLSFPISCTHCGALWGGRQALAWDTVEQKKEQFLSQSAPVPPPAAPLSPQQCEGLIRTWLNAYDEAGQIAILRCMKEETEDQKYTGRN